jgi:predicted RNase H-like HicB family nuclease
MSSSNWNKMGGAWSELREAIASSIILPSWYGNGGWPSVSGHSAGDIEQYLEAGRHEMKYLVIYEKSSNGWGAYAPDLPGLGIAAKTLDEAKDLIREAMEFHLEGMREHGESIPCAKCRN